MLLKSLDLAADGRKTGKMGKNPFFQPSHCWNVSAPSLAVVSSMMFLGDPVVQGVIFLLSIEFMYSQLQPNPTGFF